MRAKPRLGLRWLVVTFGLSLAVPLDARAEVSTPVESVRLYTGAWEYRWGDSPRLADGSLAWAAPGDAPGFLALDARGSPSGREGRTTLWLRTKLSGDAPGDDTLYLRGVDQIFEAYLDGEQIYHFGNFEGEGARRFLGYKAHYLPLGEGFHGKHLALRIHSDHVNIGLFGEPMLGERSALVTAVIKRDLPTLGMGLIMLSLGAFVFCLFLARRKERAYLTYSILALSTGAYFTAVSPSRQLVADAPLAWVHAELFCLYLMGSFLTAYFEHIFGRGWLGLVRWIRFAFVGYTALAAVLVAAGVVPVLRTLLPYQVLLLVAAVVLITRAVRGAWDGSPDARIFGAGFIAAATAGCYDVLGAMGVLSRANLPLGHIGFFILTLAMGLILARRFLEVQERLGQYSTVLGLSLASARVLEPGQQAQVALDELIRLLKAKRALLFLTRTEGERTGELELRAKRDVAGASIGAGPAEMSRSLEGLALRADVVERVRAERRPLITRSQSGKRRRSAMAAPLLIRDELLGVVYLEADESRAPFNDADLTILLGLGTQLSITIVTTRAVRLELMSALQERRIEKQGALLDAASRLAKGDIETPIAVDGGSELAELGLALEGMRRDVRAKIQMLEAKNAEVEVLNDELRRKIEARTMTLLSAVLGHESGAPVPRLKAGDVAAARYRVVRKLGEGAMGVVYEATRVTDGRSVALKLLTGAKDKPAVARFIREANILARLNHPNLVSIADVDVTEAGHLYLVMELVAGAPLDKHERRRGDVAFALSTLAQIAEGLAAVHASGVVHRDLKPSNVLVTLEPDGTPLIKLADFGISTLAGDDAIAATVEEMEGTTEANDDEKTRILPRNKPAGMNVTRTGMLVGTPGYMAPELARRSRALRPSSDVFSLGIIAYELLTEERPFPMPPLFLVVQGRPIEVPDNLRRVPGLPPSLAALFERCLAEDPDARPTAREVVDVIRRVL
ncbi:protein kinase domain-containing protein [Polyangium spumosum]|uniref:Protein kinase n=1 Tax=Polyangium spumosum TaxID=889282 RepID=A0A6N7Q6Y7_9BACT|nr:protein kinase [Polyangium spumosum]MRG98054.1 protein kinase [Polyangium spumosum]